MSTNQWSISTPQTLDLDDVNELRVSLVRGRVDVITHAEPTTIVEVSEISGRELSIELSEGILRIEHLDPGHWLSKIMNFDSRDRAVISIAVPSSIPVSVATVSAEGMVSGSGGHTTLKTVSGSLLADATNGTLSADTVSGEIIARNHRGQLNAKSVSGDVTVSGDVESIRAATVSGDLSFDITGAPRELVSTSVSGALTVRIPESQGIDLKATSTSGSITLDDERHTGIAQKIELRRGAGEPWLNIRSSSVSGNVSIMHRTPAAREGGY